MTCRVIALSATLLAAACASGSTSIPDEALPTGEGQPAAPTTNNVEEFESSRDGDDTQTPSTTLPTKAENTDTVQQDNPDTTTPSETSGELAVTHPIAELEAMWASQPYATQDNSIGIQFHNGVDYFVTEPQVTVLSAVAGTLREARVMSRQPDGAFQVNIMIIADGGQVVSYSLEPSAGPADEAKIAEQEVLSQQMLDAMTAKPGDRVDIGQPIGILLGQDEWAHVHMTVKQSNSQPEVWLCPMDYMSPGELDDLAEPTQAWADRLYQGAKTPEFCNT